ncbi:hypothetical protein C8R46DRAFT_1058631 [Mycena filopes]|nr:hypothetical protein C8R46DRAFT_1058631 [Mycena filopes]
MGKILSLAARFLARLVNFTQNPPAPQPLTLLHLPPDVLNIIFDFLLEFLTFDQVDGGRYFWDEEFSRGARLIAISATCRCLRQHARPRMFHRLSNLSKGAPQASVWPDGIWGLIHEVTLRDSSVRHPNPITLSAALFAALPRLSVLNKVILRLENPLPSQLLLALSLAPQLSSLEILQARLDGLLPPLAPSSFPSLQSLLICVWKFTTAVTTRNVVRGTENDNVATLLHSVSSTLTTLSISGDLLSPQFLLLHWPRLRKFTITEHTPTPYIGVSQLVLQMPALRELAVLFSADLTRSVDELCPPFTLGDDDGQLLANNSPYLMSVTLSNLGPDDPIFKQLPTTLEALQVVATWDLYIPEISSSPIKTKETPLTPVKVLTVIQHISRFDLVELTLTLDHFPTPALIDIIATTFPCLRFLELAASKYPYAEHAIDGYQDDALPPLLQSLEKLAFLTHLRISLNFWQRDEFQYVINRNTAGWFLTRLPKLQTISTSFQNWTSWLYYRYLQQVSWVTFHRDDFPPGWEPRVTPSPWQLPTSDEYDQPIIVEEIS